MYLHPSLVVAIHKQPAKHNTLVSQATPLNFRTYPVGNDTNTSLPSQKPLELPLLNLHSRIPSKRGIFVDKIFQISIGHVANFDPRLRIFAHFSSYTSYFKQRNLIGRARILALAQLVVRKVTDPFSPTQLLHT